MRACQKTKSIRLLEILPATEDNDAGDVSCLLRTVALETKEPYAALSYRWDRTTDSEPISINGTERGVGENLASALRQIRAKVFRAPSTLPILIWIDALCINQSDEEEKSHQVQLMGAIYSSASIVYSWLGADEAGAMTAAIKAVKTVQHVADSTPNWLTDISWMKRYPSILEVNKTGNSFCIPVWESLRTFLLDPYWTRVWILQEMVLAQSLTVMVGKHGIDFEAVMKFVQLAEQFSPESRLGEGIIPFEILYLLKSNWIPIWNHLTVRKFREHSKSFKEWRDSEKLEAIFSTLDHQATDPKDKVFALQGLLGNIIPPDYSRSTIEVYSSLVAKYIEILQDLNILHFSGTAIYPPGTVEPGTPSWVPDWQAISLQDSWLHFPALTSHSDRGLDAFRSFQARVVDERSLRVNACICDTVLDVEPILTTESVNFVRIYRKFLHNKEVIEHRTKTTYLQAIVHALLTGKLSEHQNSSNESGSSPAHRLFLATLYFLEDIVDTSASIFTKLQLTTEKLGLGFEDDISSLLRMAFPDDKIHDCWKFEKAVVWSIIGQGDLLKPCLARSLKERHHLFHTRTGYIGSSRNGVQAGDMIGVIQGCPAPVLLRKRGAQYVHLGTCYVVGLMNGEAATEIRQGSMEISEVDIV